MATLLSLGSHRAQAQMSGHSAHGQSPLVFLHGRCGSPMIWRKISRELSPLFACWTLKLDPNRHLGLRELSELARQLVQKLGSVILVGHDTGAAVAQLCALGDPKSLESLILINPSCISQAIHRVPGRHFKWRLRRYLRRRLDIASHLSALEGKELESSISPEAAHRLYRSWPSREERENLSKQLRGVSNPVLILSGGQDRMNTTDHGLEMLRMFEGARLFSHPGGGHWLPLEEPAWVSKKIREFLFKPAQRFLWR